MMQDEQAKKFGTLHDFACHPCAGAMLIFSVSFQFLRMTTEVVPEHMLLRHSINAQLGPLIQNHFHHK